MVVKDDQIAFFTRFGRINKGTCTIDDDSGDEYCDSHFPIRSVTGIGFSTTGFTLKIEAEKLREAKIMEHFKSNSVLQVIIKPVKKAKLRDLTTMLDTNKSKIAERKKEKMKQLKARRLIPLMKVTAGFLAPKHEFEVNGKTYCIRDELDSITDETRKVQIGDNEYSYAELNEILVEIIKDIDFMYENILILTDDTVKYFDAFRKFLNKHNADEFWRLNDIKDDLEITTYEDYQTVRAFPKGEQLLKGEVTLADIEKEANENGTNESEDTELDADDKLEELEMGLAHEAEKYFSDKTPKGLDVLEKRMKNDDKNADKDKAKKQTKNSKKSKKAKKSKKKAKKGKIIYK